MSNTATQQQRQSSIAMLVITFLYRIYMLFIAFPLFLFASVLTALTTTIGCQIGNGHFWGYYPGKWWSWFTIRILFLPVKIEGRENLDPKQSYVFVSNHQGAFDIFLIYGFLGRNFKWMMKKSIRKIPLVGIACEKAHHIYVDKSGASKIKKHTTLHVKPFVKECLSSYSQKVHVVLLVTWVSSVVELSC